MWARGLRALPVTAVLLVIAAGLALAVANRWREGSGVLALAAALAALLRLLLPARAVGTLAVRSRPFDVVFLLAVTAVLGVMAFAVITPNV